MNQNHLLFILLISSFPLYAQEGYPVPQVKDLLFYIQHNRGKNTYLYQTNLNSHGQIDEDKPIKISRQLFDSKGEIRPLTAIQRKFAYGIDWENNKEFTLVSYPEQKLYLRKTNSHGYLVETTINDVKMTVQRLFIAQKEGTSGLNTKVDYILFFGTDQTGKQVQSKLKVN